MPITEKIKSFSAKCVRVWRILRKPNMMEFKTTAKVSAIGLALVGLLGFIISVLLGLIK